MKPVKLLLASLLSIAAGQVSAQSAAPHFHLPPIAPQAKMPPGSAKMRAAKSTSSDSSRLIGEAVLVNDGTEYALNDSVTFTYSHGRGGDLEHNPQFDSEFVYVPQFGTDPYAYAVQTYNANNDADTAIVYYQGTLYQRTLYAFDNSHNLISQVDQQYSSEWDNTDSAYLTYDNNHNILTNTSYTWDASNNVWANNQMDMYTYNSENKMLSDITQTWDETANAWANSTQMLYTYDNTNINLTRTLTQDWVSSPAGWLNSSLDTVTYDGMNDPLTEAMLTWNTTTNAWDNNELYTYSNFYNTHPLTEIDQTWNSITGMYDNAYKLLFTYNSHTQPTSFRQLEWVDSTSSYAAGNGDVLENFYYQTYNLAVSSVISTGGNANIYPVPAQAQLNIDLKWDHAQAATVSIYDMHGRMVNQWPTGNGASYHCTFDVSNMAAGNYIINIKGGTGEIVKQLVVAH